LQLWDLGMTYASGRKLSLYDCWEKKEPGAFRERFAATVEAHDCLAVRGRLL